MNWYPYGLDINEVLFKVKDDTIQATIWLVV